MAQATTAAPTPSTTTPGPAPQKGAPGAPKASESSPTTTPTPTPTEIRKMRLKLEGQDVELPESEVIALAQQGKVSGKRFQEAAAMKKEAQEILALLDSNPAEALSKRGKNAREWAENYLMDQLKREQMSPEQQKAAENEERLRAYERAEKEAEESKKKKEHDDARQRHAASYDQLFVEALTKSGLPKTPYTIKRMAELQLSNIKNKFELGPDQLAKLVKEDYIAEQKALFGAYEGDQLLEFLGPELVKRLSKAQIAKLKAKGLQTKSSTSMPKTDGGSTGLSWREYQLKNRGRLK